jgi:hypothetical protein
MASPGQSRHERRLAQCVQELCVFVEKKTDVACELTHWAGANRDEASRLAGEFMVHYIETKSSNASLSQSVRLYRSAWRDAACIELPPDVLNKVARLEREKWTPCEMTRLNELSHKKSEQYEQLEAHWESLIAYMTKTTGAVFKEQCSSMPRVGLGTAISCELDYLGRKGEDELRITLVRARAFCSLVRATGMRSTTAIDIKLRDFTELDNDGVLLHRMENKSGSKRNVSKDVFVVIVPHVYPDLCPLVHLSELVHGMPIDECIFTQGFAKGPSLKTMVQRRFTAVLHAVAHAIGVPDMFKVKQLHAFRVLCTNAMMAHGASEAERNTHVGWTDSVQRAHYASKKHAALHAKTPYLLADRRGTDPELPHSMWLCLKDVPAEAGESYWSRARYLSATAGYMEGVEVDQAFKAQVQRQIALGNPEKEDTPSYMAKRVRELEAELAEVKATKRTRTTDAIDQLKEIVARLKDKCTASDFPAQCAAALPAMTGLLDNGGSERGSFALPQSTAEGKSLVRILVLAAVITRFGAGALDGVVEQGRSWLAWAGEARDHALVSQVSTKSWPAFKASSVASC